MKQQQSSVTLANKFIRELTATQQLALATCLEVHGSGHVEPRLRTHLLTLVLRSLNTHDLCSVTSALLQTIHMVRPIPAVPKSEAA